MFIIILINIAISCIAVYHVMTVREELKSLDEHIVSYRYNVNNIDEPMNKEIDKIV